jgi:phosphoserine phosphatase RsbU/P
LEYRSEYKENRKELFTIVFEEGQARLFLIEQMVQNQENFLRIVKENFNGQSDAGLNQFFKVWTDLFQAANLFYLQMEGEELICAASSDDRFIGENFTFLKDELEQPSFLFIGKDPEKKEAFFYVASPVVDQNGETLGALVVGNPAARLLKSLKEVDEIDYPVNLSFVDGQKKILVSSDPSLSGKTLGQAGAMLEPVEDFDKGFELNSDEKNFAALLAIPKSKYSLLISASEKRVTSHQAHFSIRIYSFLFFFILLGGGITFFLTFRFDKPLKKLLGVIDRIAEGDVEARFQKDPLGFEINALGEHLNRMVKALLDQQKRAETERLQRELFEEELKIGREIQKGMLPTSIPEVEGLDIGTGFLPAKEVGGDFYDLFLHGETLTLAIADTSGKGISSCLYSLGMRSILRSFSSLSFPLEKTILQANNLFYKDSADNGMFVTAWIGELNARTKELVYTSAGHYPLLLKRDSTLEKLTTKGIAMGAVELQEIQTDRIQLKKSDLLLLFTDGIVEATNQEGKQFGMQRLEEFLLRQDGQPSRYIAKELLAEIKKFTGNKPQEDDITFLLVRITK